MNTGNPRGVAIIAACLCAAACADGPLAPAPPSCAGTGASPISLEVGETRRLTAAEAACLWISSGEVAEYVVAWADPRGVRSAEQGIERLDFPNLVVRLSGRTDDHARAPTSAISFADAVSDVQQVSAAGWLEEAYLLRDVPFQAGELIEYQGDEDAPYRAEVRGVYGGYLVFVQPFGTSWFGGERLQALEAGIEDLVSLGIPVLQAAFGDALPVTSPDAGQLVVFGERRPASAPAQLRLHLHPLEDRAVSTMSLSVDWGITAEQFLMILTHELAHAFQWQYMDRSRPASSGPIAMGLHWAREGSADFLTRQVLRRKLQLGARENWDWRCCLTMVSEGGTYARQARWLNGRFYHGYQNAASFLNDVQLRHEGVADAAALTAGVARGANEGWYGYDVAGVHRQGLVSRMEQLTGTQWDPVSALLDWTMSAALDDRTDSAVYQNHSYLRVQAETITDWGWSPDGDVAAASGSGTEVVRPTSSVGYFRLDVKKGGGVASATSAPDDVAWMIARAK